MIHAEFKSLSLLFHSNLSTRLAEITNLHFILRSKEIEKLKISLIEYHSILMDLSLDTHINSQDIKNREELLHFVNEIESDIENINESTNNLPNKNFRLIFLQGQLDQLLTYVFFH